MPQDERVIERHRRHQLDMKFLKNKFFDKAGYIDNFLDTENRLTNIEKSERISEEVKSKFVKQFVDELLKKGLISQTTIDSVDEDANPWSIDFPSWAGSFDEKRGKKIFVIGAEPHIHFRFVQTVYGLNSEIPVDTYLENHHPLFKYLSEIVSYKMNISKQEAIEECYLTDLFPLSPMRGNGLSVGSAEKIQSAIGSENWKHVRFKYSKEQLESELKGVNPELIITQGKEVLQEVAIILGISDSLSKIPVIPKSGKRQFIRKTKWNNVPIISVPHIGSQRMRTFWNNNLTQICEVISSVD